MIHFCRGKIGFQPTNCGLKVARKLNEIIRVYADLQTPPPSPPPTTRLENKLLINVTSGNVIRLLPPLVMNEKEADQVTSILVNVLKKYLL